MQRQPANGTPAPVNVAVVNSAKASSGKQRQKVSLARSMVTGHLWQEPNPPKEEEENSETTSSSFIFSSFSMMNQLNPHTYQQGPQCNNYKYGLP